MPGIDLNPNLHQFDVPEELEGVSFNDLATQARERLGAPVEDIYLEESDVLSHRDNRVFIVRADMLPGRCFKWLSATNSLAEHRAAGQERFVVPSAGSFLLEVALAAQTYGGDVVGLVPAGAGDQKKATMREMGVEVREIDGNFDEARETAKEVAEAEGRVLLEPFAAHSNLAATGVLGQLVAERLPGVTHLVTQFGGGSLHGGMASVVKELRPDVHVTVAQAAGCSPFVDSVRSGEVREATDVPQWGTTSYFRKLGGIGVGKTDLLTLGVGSRVVDGTATTTIDHLFATMHEVKEHHGVLPEVAASEGLTAARDLARLGSLSGAVIVGVLTGANPDSYRESHLAGMYKRRQEEESSRTPRRSLAAPALT